MGLPVWRAPSPEARDALKADPTAPARSPIRRRRPTRSPPSPRLLDSDPRAVLSRLSHLQPSPRHSSSRRRPRLPPPPVPEPRSYSRRELSASPPSLPPYEGSSARSYTRPVPDARSYVRPFHLSLDDPRPLPALTPNFAPAAASRNASHDPADDVLDRPQPASRFSRRISEYGARVNLHLARLEAGRSRWSEHHDNSDSDNSDGNAVGFPPLRRMGRRTIADGPLPSSSLRESWSPATTLDGLGDRERSISPVDDHWDTMQSSVAPDPLPPTADSSFTSAAASASFSNSHPSSRAGSSNSNSASSSRTHLTIPSRRQSTFDQFLRACDTSEDESASDTEEEDVEERDATLRRLRSLGSSLHEPPPPNPYRYAGGVRERSRESSAYVRSFYGEVTAGETERLPERRMADQFDGPADEAGAPEEDMTLDQELRDARAILERLTRRDDISDEFWASVGLRRPLADRVERIQQRERL